MLVDPTIPVDPGIIIWYCPTCGHRIVVSLPTSTRRYSKITVFAGDTTVNHGTVALDVEIEEDGE